jgi:cholesterol transport system auxiliary component
MRRLLPFAAAALVGACAGTGGSPPTPRTYDLGIAAPGAQLPPIRIAAVRAAVPFEGDDMHYRLAWRNPSELASYASSRWAAPPAELLRKQLLRSSPPDAGARCALEIELQEFTQVFASREASEARIELRGTLWNANQRVVARGWNVSEPAQGSDAAAGVAAITRATDRTIAELAEWILAQPACR